VLGSFLPLLIYLIALRLFDRKTAIITGAVAVFYPTFIYYESTLLIESIMVLLTALILWQLYRCQRTLSVIDFILAGLLLGIAGLARPNILMLGPFLFLWVWLVIKPELGWKKSIIRYALIAASSLVIILPVTIRNYTTGNDTVFIAWQGGFNFFLGNNRTATGWSATVAGIDYTWEGGYNQAIALAEKVERRELKPSEVSDFWYEQAFKEIRENPGYFLALQIKKLRLLFNGYEIPNNQDIYLAGEYAPILKLLMFESVMFFPYGIVAPLALIGIGFSIRHWRKYLLLYVVLAAYIGTLQLFFVCARFRQPIIPILLMFAVFGALRFFELIKRRDKKNLLLASLALGLLLIESNHDLTDLDRNNLRAQNHLLLGGAYLEMGRMASADREFKKSIEWDSKFAGGYNNIGLIAVRRGELQSAAQNFLKAIQSDPYALDGYMNYATMLIENQQLEPALEILHRAQQVQPLNDLVNLKIGITQFQLGRLDSALVYVEESLRLNPRNDAARQVYEELLKEK
jgi:Tfp pilus assembly protein PilF